LVLDSSVPPAALEGLDGFSHVWVLFKFHINVESGKQRKANEGTRYAAKVWARAFGCGAPTHRRIAWGFF
jgi:tRNA (Thr-GGU) A37 N-methylase